jgi:NAD dependent epimerase/dehydratase family enzyme
MRWLLGEQADLLLEGQRVIPHNLLSAGFQFEFPTIASALADLCE